MENKENLSHAFFDRWGNRLTLAVISCITIGYVAAMIAVGSGFLDDTPATRAIAQASPSADLAADAQQASHLAPAICGDVHALRNYAKSLTDAQREGWLSATLTAARDPEARRVLSDESGTRITAECIARTIFNLSRDPNLRLDAMGLWTEVQLNRSAVITEGVLLDVLRAQRRPGETIGRSPLGAAYPDPLIWSPEK